MEIPQIVDKSWIKIRIYTERYKNFFLFVFVITELIGFIVG